MFKCKTCADCEYHRCRLMCVDYVNCCDGFCEYRKTHKVCYTKQCENYKLDKFFK